MIISNSFIDAQRAVVALMIDATEGKSCKSQARETNASNPALPDG